VSGEASARPGNYALQSRTYDLTRGASPTVVRAITRLLGPADARSLLDIAGGTGNYARSLECLGFRVTMVDTQPAMLARAATKLERPVLVAGDAQLLPLRDAGFDCAAMVNAIHLFDGPGRALLEARRILRAGPLVFTAFTQANIVGLFVFEYFGLPDEIQRRPGNEEVLAMVRAAGFGRVEHHAYVYDDIADGSLNAMHTDARVLADENHLRNTSFWHRLDEATRRRGLEDLARDLRSGRLGERVATATALAVEHGHGTVFAAWP
jgi:SAM-dependent methyltransferase